MEQKYKILGFNDDQTSCDICGKEELRGTYAMEDMETGVIFRAGSTCGATMAGWSIKELKQIFKAGEKEKMEKAKQEFRNTPEYIAHEKAIQYLNNEADEIERRLLKCSDQAMRNKISEDERTPSDRMQYLKPTREALEAKKTELSNKYNLPTHYFH